MIQTVAVGSLNPVKLAAVDAVISRLSSKVTVVAVEASSGVSDQPWGDAMTKHGALNRAQGALETANAQLGVGIEGGVVQEEDGSVRTCAWAAAIDRDGRVSYGGSMSLLLPNRVVALLHEGRELSKAMDIVANQTATGRGQGVVGILTGELIDRQRAYEPLVMYALAPWIAPRYYDSYADCFGLGL